MTIVSRDDNNDSDKHDKYQKIIINNPSRS